MVSSDSWVTLTVAGTSVSYTVVPNPSNSSRSATLTIGTQSVAVAQSTGGPILNLNSSHSGSFFAGESGASYLINLAIGGTGTTSGPITIADTLPAGFTATAIGGAGWSCTLATLRCSRTDALSGGTNYSFTVTVTVPGNQSGSVTNQVTLSNGGLALAIANDPTTILSISPCNITQDSSPSVSDVQQMVNEALGTAVAENDINQDGSVNVVDVQIVINAVLTQVCSSR